MVVSFAIRVFMNRPPIRRNPYYNCSVGRVLLIFIDGLGLGNFDPACNPLARFFPRVLACFSDRAGPLPRQGLSCSIDARLDVPGLPQSATGQATLFTGVNAAQLIGQHLSGFPNQKLRDLLSRKSLVTRLCAGGYSVNFANTYTPAFVHNRPRWVSATTVMCESAGLRLNTLTDLRAGRSLFMDFTNRLLARAGHDVPIWSEKEAAGVLIGLAAQYDFCFYEYFLSDLAGHRGTPERNAQLLRSLDEFLFHVVCGMDVDESSLVITSDHGNVENSCVPGHTMNPVPGLFWGPIRSRIEGIRQLDLTSITPLIEAVVRGVPKSLINPKSDGDGS